MKRYLLMLLTLLALTAGCRKESEPQKKNPAAGVPPWEKVYIDGTPEAEIKNVILRYDQLLKYGYEKLNMNPLQEVTTLKLAEKAYYHMAAIGEGGVRMTSNLTKIQFERINLKAPGKAHATVRETWDFAYNDIKTGVKKEEMKDFVYIVEYELEQQNGRWMIVDIGSKDEDPSRKAVTVTPPGGKSAAGATPGAATAK